MEQHQNQPPHVAIVPSPGMGHVIPLVEFAKRLVGIHGFTATFIVPASGPPPNSMSSLLAGMPEPIDHVFLPPVSFDDLPEASKIETRIALTVSRSLPALRHALASLPPRRRVSLTAIVVDIFGTDAIDVARELNVISYIFYPGTAMSLSLMLHLPDLDETTPSSKEFADLPEIKIPGCIPVPGKDLPDPVLDRKNDAYKWTLHTAKRYRLADGIMVNSFDSLEPGVFSSFREMRVENDNMPPVYPVGPLASTKGNTEEGDNCLTWLDKQPRGSVLFVSFGSGGTLGSHQITELASGLEMIGERFLWVVRRPNDKVSNATYFSGGGIRQNGEENDASFDFLPDGFLTRTRERGMVVESWAPQARILSHGSTGGFVSHCGWNSVLESMASGVPLIAWPLFAEQKLNGLMLSSEVGVALSLKKDENGVVPREEIARAVKDLFHGEDGRRVRKRMEDFREAGFNALQEDGTSTYALAQVVHHLNTKLMPY